MQASISNLAETFVKSTSVEPDDTFQHLENVGGQLPMSGNKRHRLATHNNDSHVHHVRHDASQREIVFIYRPRLMNVNKKRLNEVIKKALPGFKKVKLSENNMLKGMLRPFYALQDAFTAQHLPSLLSADEDLTVVEKKERIKLRNQVMESFSAQLLVMVKEEENKGNMEEAGGDGMPLGHMEGGGGGEGGDEAANGGEEEVLMAGQVVDPDTFLDPDY